MIYRVELKISYLSVWFDFKNSEDAINFAETCIKNNVPNEDGVKPVSVTIKIFDKNEESEEEE